MPYWHENDAAMIPADDGEEYLTTLQAARKLNVHPGTLNNWRAQEIGPKVQRFGRIVRYRARDLDSWLDWDDHRV